MSFFRRVEKIDYAAMVDISDFIADVAIDTLEDEQTRGWPIPRSDFTTLVDNKEGRSEYDVKNAGRIEYILPTNLLEITLFVMDMLIAQSPLGKGAAANRSGRYNENHKIIVNGHMVDEMQLKNMIANPPPNEGKNDQVLIVNTQPYAQKIERGESMQTPTGVYKRVAAAAKRRFGKVAFISKKSLTAAQIPGQAKTEVTKRKGTKGGGPVQVAAIYPAIRISRGRGTL